MSPEPIEFVLVGMVTSFEFQKCRCYLQQVRKSFPRLYRQPTVRPMLNFEWNEYLTKMRRKVGGKLWSLRANCVLLLDGEVLGGDVELLDYLSTKFRLSIKRDFYKLGAIQLREMLQKTIDSGRKFAHMTIAVDGKTIGTMLVLLYADFVPRTVNHFFKCCKHWANTPIHRIVQRCWFQCKTPDVKLRKMPCENYVVPHDRRGVVSTCNSSKHSDNTLQFNISLNPTPWMNHKYVAFGQLVQGDEVLSILERIPTCYETPTKSIVVTECGEFKLDVDFDEKTIREVEAFMAAKDQTGKPTDVVDVHDVDSELSVNRYMQGLYSLSTDAVSLAHTLIPAHLQRMYETEALTMTGEEEASDVPEDERVRHNVLTSGEDLRFQGDIYSKPVLNRFKIEDSALPHPVPSGNKEWMLSVTNVTAPIATHTLEQAEIESNQYNPLYL